MDETKRGKWIAVLVLVIAGGLFGRSIAHQLADQKRVGAVGLKESETISTSGLYELHTGCAQQCRERGDVPGAKWHERILAHMRGDSVDESANLDDAGEVTRQDRPQPISSMESLQDPTHVPGVNVRLDTGELLPR